MTRKEELEKRIGWLASECGHEDFHIQKLQEEIGSRKKRRDAMSKECSRLAEELNIILESL